ncbi:uncharacterized protein LOC142620517 [Castanea sativa]|uniref:uncharacterized protein LOC142620517 n=1 Tax=Castanea sativa TaxID=21020 RepID=UPI003F64996A
MDKYLIRKPRTQDSSPVQDSFSSSKRIRVDFNLENLPSDPRLREKISSYHPNNYDEIRKYYLAKDPCQPYDYPLVKLDSHVGGVDSAHNQAVKKSEDLLKEKQHIQSVLVKQSNQDKAEYRIQLNAIVDCIRFLLCRGLAFRGHDESQGSSDKGNFLELLQFLGDHNESINEVSQKIWKNCKLTHHDIQKDIVNAIARETSKVIIKDLDNGFFSILVDESRDISMIEQMALVLCYVNKK